MVVHLTVLSDGDFSFPRFVGLLILSLRFKTCNLSTLPMTWYANDNQKLKTNVNVETDSDLETVVEGL
jgi:hypothetical protein